MNKYFAILLVATVANGVNGNLFGSSSSGKTRFFDLKPLATEADFKGLNKYLVGKLEASDESGLNLKQIEAKINNLPAGIKKAAQLVLDLSKFNECNDNVLVILKQIGSAGLKSFGLKRIEKVIKAELTKAINSCTQYIERSIQERFFGSPIAESLTNIAAASTLAMQNRSIVKKKSLTRRLFAPVHESKHKFYPVDVHTIADILEILSKDDPQAKFSELVGQELTGKTSVVKHRENFEYAFNKYLVEPCQEMSSTLGDLLDGAGWLASIQRSDSDDLYSFVESRDVMFQGLAWMYKDCQSVLKMKDSKKAVMFKELISE